VAETCTGSTATCPTDAFKPSTTECRGLDGVCDIAESCTGSSAECPTDVVEPSTTVCRPSVDVQCDPEERCDGQVAVCPPETFEPNGLMCDDSDPETVDENCFNGHCGCTGQDLDGDNTSDNCDTDDADITIKKVVAYATRTKPGRIKANGTLQTLVYGPTDQLNPSQGFIITVSDAGSMLHVRSLAQADCKVRPTGTVQCRTEDGLDRFYAKPNPKVPGQMKWKFFSQDLQIDQPQVGPITIVIQQEADLVDRVGQASICKVSAASLSCK